MRNNSRSPVTLFAALSLLAGCSSLDEATASLTEGAQTVGDAVTGLFRGRDETDDPIYKCQAEGHGAGTKAYQSCLDAAVAAHCGKYGALNTQPNQDCRQYYQDLGMVRRQVRAYGYTR